MRTGTRQTVERGIYKDRRGFEVVAWAGPLRDSKRFPLDASLKTMRKWRDDTASDLRDDAQPTADSKTLSGAIAVYRKKVDHNSVPEKAALNAWIAIYPHVERRKLTPAMCQQAIERWRNAGRSPQTLYYRRLVLVKLWRALDGPKVKTPVDDVRVVRPKARRPVWVSDDVIQRVAAQLRHHETKGGGTRLRSAKTRARFLVLATTGQRPSQLKRARPADVDFERGVWRVRAAKGGEPIPLFMNAEIRAAWQLFRDAKAWGKYNTRNFARTIRRNGWPDGVRVYNLRHATALTLRVRGADLGDIQDHLGHGNISTTRIYASAIAERMQMTSQLLEGRFPDWAKISTAVSRDELGEKAQPRAGRRRRVNVLDGRFRKSG